MGQVQAAIAELMARELQGRPEWDEAPAVYLLLLAGKRPALAPLAVPESVWDAGQRAGMRIPDVLRSLAGGMQVSHRRGDRYQPGGGAVVHGVAFRHEGWGLASLPRPGTAAMSEAAADAMAHRIHARPDRVELRMLIAVDRAGITYQAELLRGSPEAVTRVLYPGSAVQAGGYVVESLDIMLRAATGAEPPARPAGW